MHIHRVGLATSKKGSFLNGNEPFSFFAHDGCGRFPFKVSRSLLMNESLTMLLATKENGTTRDAVFFCWWTAGIEPASIFHCYIK